MAIAKFTVQYKTFIYSLDSKSFSLLRTKVWTSLYLRFQKTFLIFGFEIITQLTRYVSEIVLRLPPGLDGIQNIVQYFWLANTLVAKLSLNKDTSFHSTNTINNVFIMRLFSTSKMVLAFRFSLQRNFLDRCAAFQSGANGLLSHQHVKPVNENIFSIGWVVKIGLEFFSIKL